MERAPIVFPVRFATHNAAVQTTTRELSPEGVFVRCLEPPPSGTPIEMKLYLPGRRESVKANAVIREVAPAGQGAPVPARGLVVHRLTKEEAEERGTLPGVGVQFVDADDAFRDRIDAAIEYILKETKE